MKILLIWWALGLAACDKLDRTYLPPRGSISAGGHPEDLNLPLEFPKESLSSTLKPGSNRTSGNSINPKFPSITFGIDRQDSFVTSSPKSTNRPEVASKNIYNIPSSTTPYDLTFSPVEVFDTTVGPVTTVPQGYSSMPSSFDPNLNYDQYLIQENIKANKVPQTIPNYFSRGSVPNPPKQNIGIVSGNSAIQATNNVDEASLPYEGDLDSISEVKNPNANKSYLDKIPGQQTFDAYPNQRLPVKSDDRNVKFFDPINTGLSSAMAPEKPFIGKLVSNKAPSTYSSNPTSSNFDTRYDKKYQPQRAQAEDDRNAVILNFENILTPEGFAYSFDTSNGIHADESGTTNNGVKAKGSYSFTGDDGKIYTVEYTADENGFLPRGDHLPTAPPIPNAILKVIEQAEMNRILGIVEDGSYDNAKYGPQKYQGLMDRVPQNQYNNNIVNQPNYNENSKTTIFGNKLPVYSENNGEVEDNISSSSKPGSSNSAKMSKTDEAYRKGINTDENDKKLPSFHSTNKPDENRLFVSEADNFNNKPNTERNKFRANTIGSYPRSDVELDPNSAKEYETLNPVSFTNVLPKKNNAQNQYNSGYVYASPQNMFNDKDPNNVYFPNVGQNYDATLDDDKSGDIITTDEYTIPNTSFNFRKPVTNSPMMKKTYPSNFSTTQKYELPYISNDNGKQSTYPSSAFGPKYSTTRTSKPTDISSPSTPSTGTAGYSVITPTTPLITSTLRPSITSRRPSSIVTPRTSAYTGRTSEPEEIEDSRLSTTIPSTFGESIFGRPQYDGRPNKIVVNEERFPEDSDLGSAEYIDPSSDALKPPARPGNYNTQSSSEKVISEDFSGPKQLQRFDPKYGYYY